jgi:hypothetical protein
MKKLLLLVSILMLITVTSYSQNKDEVNYIQSAWGMEKREVVKNHMKLTESEAKDFWTVYDKYEDLRKELGRDRITTIMEYSNNIDSLTDSKAEDLMTKSLANQTKFLDLLNTVYTQMKAILPLKKASQFVQLENYLDTVIKLKVMEEIPLIGETKK